MNLYRFFHFPAPPIQQHLEAAALHAVIREFRAARHRSAQAQSQRDALQEAQASAKTESQRQAEKIDGFAKTLHKICTQLMEASRDFPVFSEPDLKNLADQMEMNFSTTPTDVLVFLKHNLDRWSNQLVETTEQKQKELARLKKRVLARLATLENRRSAAMPHEHTWLDHLKQRILSEAKTQENATP